MLKSIHKSKNSYFYNILVSSRDAAGAMTLNVVWMEREIRTDGHRVTAHTAPMHTHRAVIKRDAPCER